MQRFPYRGHRFPAAAIQHAAWLHFRFALSLRGAEETLAEHRLNVLHKTVRRWAGKFGPQFARALRKRRLRPTGRWHLDKAAVRIAGKWHWLRRTVDDKGEVLGILIQNRRNTAAAARLLRKRDFAPKAIAADTQRHLVSRRTLKAFKPGAMASWDNAAAACA